MATLMLMALQKCWSKINDLSIEESHGDRDKILSKPHDQHGAQMMQITDPSGVLWHVREGAVSAYSKRENANVCFWPVSAWKSYPM